MLFGFAMWQAPLAPVADGKTFLWLAMGVGALALIVALLFARAVIGSDKGTSEMQSIASAIREGAEAFMSQQYQTIGLIAIVLAVVLFFGYNVSPRTAPYATKTVVSFLVGAVCSGAGGLYRNVCVDPGESSGRLRRRRTSLNGALQMALRGGAVTGLVVVALSLLGVGVLVPRSLAGWSIRRQVPYQLVGFGFGASLVALFAQLGGGIYTKAADVGADLVGKVEAGIPEDDPRNPAVIADLVGDNVGDCAGRGADIFESTAAENVGAMILGAALYPVFGIKGILFPLIVHAINLIASMVGVVVVKAKEDGRSDACAEPRLLCDQCAGAGGICGCGLRDAERAGRAADGCWAAAWSASSRRSSSCGSREYYTESRYRPVRSIAEASPDRSRDEHHQRPCGRHGDARDAGDRHLARRCCPATTSACRGWRTSRSISDYAKGIYGTAIATMGMLSCAAYILAMDTFGPITDNAGGIIEMSKQPDDDPRPDGQAGLGRQHDQGADQGLCDRLGFAGGFPAVLRVSRRDSRRLWSTRLRRTCGGPATSCRSDWSFTNINLAQMPVFVGALLGAMLTYLFSSLAIKAVGRTAQMVVKDVRAQFKENPGIMAGTSSRIMPAASTS